MTLGRAVGAWPAAFYQDPPEWIFAPPQKTALTELKRLLSVQEFDCAPDKKVQYILIMLPFRLPPEIARRLENIAAATGRSAAFCALESALKHICALEDIYMAEQRLADLRAGRTETIPMEDLILQFRETGSAPVR